MIAPHPLGVRPAGNALLAEGYSRGACMGRLGALPDELLALVLQELPARDLLALGHTCKALFAYCWFDELWKQHVYEASASASAAAAAAAATTADEGSGHEGSGHEGSGHEGSGHEGSGHEGSGHEGSGHEGSGGRSGAPLRWLGSWRRTALRLDAGREARVDAAGRVYSDLLFRPFELAQIDYGARIRGLDAHAIARFDEAELTNERFVAGGLWRRPFVARLARPIAQWTVADLVARFGDSVFRQECMDWPLALYAEYMRSNTDETPLYLFDCHSPAHAALRFERPLTAVFGEDFFELLGAARRPDHEWLIVGPRRSGSTFHKDPNGTSAWNAAVSGRKYWIMFPPDALPPGVWTDAAQSEVTAPVSLAEWFCAGFYDEARRTRGFCHAVTQPGECMYVPSGWWHAVANLDECVAMTGNFVPRPQLPAVLAFLRDKPDQISGFKNADGLYDTFAGLLAQHGVDVAATLAEADAAARPPKKKARVEPPPQPFTFSFSLN